MLELFKNNDKLTAFIPDATVSIGAAEEKDSDKLAAIYSDVKIGRRNYRARFDSNSNESFRDVGGMFNALSGEELKEIIHDGNSSILTAKRDTSLIGLLWVSRTDPAFCGYMPADEELMSAIDSGKLLYFRDIIVTGATISKKVTSLLIYAAIKFGAQAGYTHSLAEIYKVMYYNDGVRREVGLLNKRSLNTATSSGGRFIGELPAKTILMDGMEVGVESNVVVFEYASAFDMLKQKITAMEINIEG